MMVSNFFPFLMFTLHDVRESLVCDTKCVFCHSPVFVANIFKTNVLPFCVVPLLLSPFLLISSLQEMILLFSCHLSNILLILLFTHLLSHILLVLFSPEE
jgi:hypothetical protein